MRVIFPHVKAHPVAEAALETHAPDAERFFLGFRPDAYWRLLADLWAAGEGFLIVEQDVELHAGIVEGLEACAEPWCLHPYNGPGFAGPGDPLLYQALGCTRFTTGLIAEEPDLMAVVGAAGGGLNPADWRRLDCTIAPELRGRGYAPHLHWPAVAHHHVYPNEGCACGRLHNPEGAR